MIKLFNNFTTKKHDFIVKEENLIEVMKMIQLTLCIGSSIERMSLEQCDYNIGDGSWSIRVNLNEDQWHVLLCECKKSNYQLLVKSNPNQMYFYKKES